MKLIRSADRIRTHGPHPEEPCGARRLEGWPLARPRPWPSFETPTFGRLLRTRLIDEIAQRAIAGLLAAVLAGTAALAQAPRSVTILPDIPEAPAATRVPDISSRLVLLNSTVKVENSAGVSVDLLPKLEVSVGSKIGFRIATKKTGYLILLDVDASGRLTQIFPNPTTATHGLRDTENLIKT